MMTEKEFNDLMNHVICIPTKKQMKDYELNEEVFRCEMPKMWKRNGRRLF